MQRYEKLCQYGYGDLKDQKSKDFSFYFKKLDYKLAANHFRSTSVDFPLRRA